MQSVASEENHFPRNVQILITKNLGRITQMENQFLALVQGVNIFREREREGEALYKKFWFYKNFLHKGGRKKKKGKLMMFLNLQSKNLRLIWFHEKQIWAIQKSDKRDLCHGIHFILH